MKLFNKYYRKKDTRYSDEEAKKVIKKGYENYIKNINRIIFSNINMDTLSDYEKRKMIFDFLCNNHKFSYEDYYDKILNSFCYGNVKTFLDLDEKNSYLHARAFAAKVENEDMELDFNTNLSSYYSDNPEKTEEMLKKYLEDNDCYSDKLYNSVLDRLKSGKFNITYNVFDETAKLILEQLASNGEIDCVYKSLLELNDIYALRVICSSNNSPIDHGICLVYDSETEKFSFDDITSYLYGVAPIEDCFDYDLEDAKKLGQGNRTPRAFCSMTNDDTFGLAISSFSNGILPVDREKLPWYESFGVEKENEYAYQLPENIKSKKKGAVTK